MAKIPHLIILLVLLISVVAAKTPVNAIARREDIPFIKCQVCEKIAQQINDQIKKKESQISSKKASQYEIVEIFQNVCKLKKDGADWILQTDIVENGDILELVDQGTEGQCNSECKTIEHACQEIIGEWDRGVAEYVYKSQPSVDTLVNFLCKELSEACPVKAPPVPKNRIPGEPFIAKPSKDAEMEEILRPMEGMPGAPGMKMCSRDDLMNMNKFGDKDADDDDDDNFPGKLLRGRQARQAVTSVHHGGGKSSSSRAYANNDQTGEVPTRVDLYRKLYVRDDNSPASQDARDRFECMQQHLQQAQEQLGSPLSREDVHRLSDEAVDMYYTGDAPERVHLTGQFITPTEYRRPPQLSHRPPPLRRRADPDEGAGSAAGCSGSGDGAPAHVGIRSPTFGSPDPAQSLPSSEFIDFSLLSHETRMQIARDYVNKGIRPPEILFR